MNNLGPVSIIEAAGNFSGQLEAACDAEAKGGRLLKDKPASPLLTRQVSNFLTTVALASRAAATLKGSQLRDSFGNGSSCNKKGYIAAAS